MVDRKKIFEVSPSIKSAEAKNKRLIARRKLIKTSAVAVPVVLTLRSGAATAAASAYGCVENNRNLIAELNDNKEWKKFSASPGATPLMTVGVSRMRMYEVRKDVVTGNWLTVLNKRGKTKKRTVVNQDPATYPKWWTTGNNNITAVVAAITPPTQIDVYDVKKPLEKILALAERRTDGFKDFAVFKIDNVYGLAAVELTDFSLAKCPDGQNRIVKISQADLTNLTYSCYCSINPNQI